MWVVRIDPAERYAMTRRVEVGAGIGAAVLSVVALVMLLLAPLVPECSGAVIAGRCPVGIRYVSLPSVAASVDNSVWLYIGAMLLVLLAGAAGAVLDGTRRPVRRAAAGVLWACTALALAGCLTVAAPGGALGFFYAPAVMGLAIASYAAWARRARPRTHAAQDHVEPAGEQPEQRTRV